MMTHTEDRSKDYAKCATCDIRLITPDDAKAHRESTMDDNGSHKRSHLTQVLNPTKQEQFARQVQQIADDALMDAMERIDRLLQSDEVDVRWVKGALSGYVDFDDAWDDWEAEGE